jgi:CheY-like chemotaxis protein
MVYGFVKQSRGHVHVESERGRGTTVTLYFPLSNRAPEPLASAAPTPADAQGSGEVVLLLEDEPVVRQVAEMMLGRLGYRVVSATTGREALERAQNLPRIDLFLTDVVLPGGMNGCEVAEELKRQRPGLRVLYASGYSDRILEHRGQLPPTLRRIAKPYDIAQLAEAVRKAMKEDRSA